MVSITGGKPKYKGGLGAEKGRQSGFFPGGKDRREDQGLAGTGGDKETSLQEAEEKGVPSGGRRRDRGRIVNPGRGLEGKAA
jgi:hypothetical protein